jgi:endonuclease/exonuclease/phosphatase family metal-dependent hydrolase
MRLRAASFNVRTSRSWDGPHSWPLRRGAAAGTVARLRADVIGLQEVRGGQQRDLLRRMPGYAACGAGRDDGLERGERCTILYDARRLVLERWATRWFSDTPDAPGPASWGGPPPRVATLAWFRARLGGARFAVADAHWDGASADARRRSAEALIGWIDDGLPWLVIGDLNTTADDPSVRRLVAGGLRDPLARLGAGGPGAGTHHRWDGRTDWTRIDYVLVTKHWRVRAAAVVHDLVDDRLPSDHWPVLVSLELPNGEGEAGGGPDGAAASPTRRG